MRGAEGPAGGLLERPTLPFDADSAFALAAGGLRRLHGRGGALAGYTAEELFWRDVLELVHEDDGTGLRLLLSEVVEGPDACQATARVRLREAPGGWAAAEFTIRKVLEAPGDAGLIVADIRTR